MVSLATKVWQLLHVHVHSITCTTCTCTQYYMYTAHMFDVSTKVQATKKKRQLPWGKSKHYYSKQ